MNRREHGKIETRTHRVGGEVADLLGVVKELLPLEYDSLLKRAQEFQDEMRRIRRVADDELRNKYTRSRS